MSEPTTDAVTQKTDKTNGNGDESKLFSLSARAFIAIMLVLSVCAIDVYGAIITKDLEVHEPLYSLVVMAVGFFFGQKTTKL